VVTYRDAPNKPICALHADVAENLAGTPNGGSASASLTTAITLCNEDPAWCVRPGNIKRGPFHRLTNEIFLESAAVTEGGAATSVRRASWW
jgi:hypothetical protein